MVKFIDITWKASTFSFLNKLLDQFKNQQEKMSYSVE